MTSLQRRAFWLACALVVGVMLAAASASPPTAFARGGRTPTPTRTPSPTATAGTPQPTPTPTETRPPLTITTTSMPDGNVGTYYGNFITSSGGQGTPHQWRLIAGSLPSGLTMASSFGVYSTSVTGTPRQVQTTTFTVEVRDTAGNRATRTLSIRINPPRPLVITNQSSTLAGGTVGASYATSLFADGGIQPYTWRISAGQLPPGLRLSGNTISGTPTTRGTYTFTATVSDSGGQQASQQFSITVS